MIGTIGIDPYSIDFDIGVIVNIKGIRKIGTERITREQYGLGLQAILEKVLSKSQITKKKHVRY